MRGNELLEAIQLVDAKYLEPTDPSAYAKRRVFKRAFAFVACLCFLIVTVSLIASPKGNSFGVVAYAAEPAQDGTVTLCETDLLTSSLTLGGYYDGETMYLGLGLQYRGSNLKSVSFKATDGIFATQTKTGFSAMHPLTDVQVNKSRIHILPPTAFDVRGKTLVLDSDTPTDLLVFWGHTPDRLPEKLTIEATAVFTDGQTQQTVIPIDLSDNPLVTAMDTNALSYLYFSFSDIRDETQLK